MWMYLQFIVTEKQSYGCKIWQQNEMEDIMYRELSKCAATSPHLSQSSPVILYMLTRLLTLVAIAGVTLVPGDNEYTIG